jgi:hypothetical protein
MSIEISRETEARLTAEAQRQGISVSELLERFITERAVLTHAAKPELPIWHLGVTGDLHRRDLYNDVR